jgi:galactitol-specific phosphotransferase system IIB component
VNQHAARELIDALFWAVKDESQCVQVFASDGEEYDLHVTVTDNPDELPEQEYRL